MEQYCGGDVSYTTLLITGTGDRLFDSRALISAESSQHLQSNVAVEILTADATMITLILHMKASQQNI
jgi:hypothetical protein